MKLTGMLSTTALITVLSFGLAPAVSAQEPTPAPQPQEEQPQPQPEQQQQPQPLPEQQPQPQQQPQAEQPLQPQQQPQQPQQQPQQQQMQQQQQRGFVATAEAEGFREWATGVRTTGWEQRIGDRPYTAFVAQDAAYQRVPAQTRDAWRTDPTRHRAAVGYTLVEGRLTAEDLRTRDHVMTVDGQRLPVRTVGDRIMVGDATIDRADVAAGPGVIHGVDRVLLPAERVQKEQRW